MTFPGHHPWCNLAWTEKAETCRMCADFNKRFPVGPDMYTEFFPNTKPLTAKEQQTIDELKAIALEYDVAIIPGSSRTRLAGAEPV